MPLCNISQKLQKPTSSTLTLRENYATLARYILGLLQRSLRVEAIMAVGDKEAAVIACVNGALKRRGYNPPYDPSKAMNGNPVYGYQPETMIMFHRNVKACLATKGYIYSYSETLAYMNQTLAMTLAQIYGFIAVNTAASAVAGAAAPPPGALVEASSADTVAAKKTAVTPDRAKAGAGPAAKKAAKKKVAKKKAAPKKKAASKKTKKKTQKKKAKTRKQK
jgi:hypothetical protein